MMVKSPNTPWYQCKLIWNLTSFVGALASPGTCIRSPLGNDLKTFWHQILLDFGDCISKYKNFSYWIINLLHRNSASLDSNFWFMLPKTIILIKMSKQGIHRSSRYIRSQQRFFFFFFNSQRGTDTSLAFTIIKQKINAVLKKKGKCIK